MAAVDHTAQHEAAATGSMVTTLHRPAAAADHTDTATAGVHQYAETAESEDGAASLAGWCSSADSQSTAGAEVG